MKILIVTQYFPPESALISFDLATDLASHGHEVRVITGYPNYPDGKLYPGYKQRWRLHETMGEIDVLRVPLYLDHSQSFIRRTANYLSFGFSAATARHFAREADVVYVYATQMTPAIGPWIWRALGGPPYVLHVQDLWPDSIIGSSITSDGFKTRIIKKLLSPWLALVYRAASSVIGIAPTMVETLTERGVDRDKTELVFNWSADLSLAKDPIVRPQKSDGFVHIVYAGNVGDMQDLGTAIHAAVQTAHLGVRLTVVGKGVAKPALIKLAKQLDARNVEFRDSVPRNEMTAIYAEADFGLVTLRDLPVFNGTVPSKFQAILAHGVPVITNVQGDVRTITELHALGFTANAESVSSLAKAFESASEYPWDELRLMSDRSRATAEKLFSKKASIERIETILHRAANGEKKNNE